MAQIKYPKSIILFCACSHRWMVGKLIKDTDESVPIYRTVLETSNKRIAIANYWLQITGEAVL